MSMPKSIYLSRLFLNLRNPHARRGLHDCGHLHRTIMVAFPDGLSQGMARAESGVLFRVEVRPDGRMELLVQSEMEPDWAKLPPGYVLGDGAECKVIDRIIAMIQVDAGFRFRLLANPTRKIGTKTGPDGKKNNGKRVELRGEDAWIKWLQEKSERNGFRLRNVRMSPHCPSVMASGQSKVSGTKGAGGPQRTQLTFAGVLFEGVLEVSNPELFLGALRAGIGTGKAFGFGLLSLAPVAVV